MIRFSPLVLLVLVFCALGACEKALQPKPKAGLRLTYPEPQYVPLTQKLPFRFEYNNQASVQPSLKTAPNLFYPKLKATLYLSYRPIQNNLNSLLSDAYTLPS
ncbi:MAG: gliding motility lipoprotein GldD, partial [Flavobacteriaceae bacterium]